MINKFVLQRHIHRLIVQSASAQTEQNRTWLQFVWKISAFCCMNTGNPTLTRKRSRRWSEKRHHQIQQDLTERFMIWNDGGEEEDSEERQQHGSAASHFGCWRSRGDNPTLFLKFSCWPDTPCFGHQEELPAPASLQKQFKRDQDRHMPNFSRYKIPHTAGHGHVEEILCFAILFVCFRKIHRGTNTTANVKSRLKSCGILNRPSGINVRSRRILENYLSWLTITEHL